MNAYEIPVWQMSVDEVKALIETNRQQADRIAELEKQSEVMAYIYQDPDTLQPALKFANPTNYWATVISTPDIPLYTTPQTKPLSDNQILNLFEPKYDVEIDDEMLITFARAIEAKVRGNN